MSRESEGTKSTPIDDTAEEAKAADETTTPIEAAVDEVTMLKQQLEEQKNDYLRLAAEFDNFRKRTRRDIAEIIKSANESLISQLLDVLDNFERALKSQGDKVDIEAYNKGVALVYDKLNGILSNAGLKRFDSVGETFDPRLHEALMQVDAEDKEPDTIALELLPGYTLNDKVIRHAQVGVVKFREEK